MEQMEHEPIHYNEELLGQKQEKSRAGAYVIIGLVCLLLVFSVVQTFQISSVQENMQKSTISTGIAATGGAVARDAQPRAAAVPAMVGGC